MKEAQAMRYGGLFVQASECDYTSFKHQGLLCPICKKSVFLVASSERSPHQRTLKNGAVSEVKQARVDAYFAHHPDTEKSSVEACELRSTQITQAQKALVAAQSRGQRQKALQAHCWKILKTSIRLTDIDATPKLLYFYWLEATMHYREEKASKRMYQLLIDNLCEHFRSPSLLAETKKNVFREIDNFVNGFTDSSLISPRFKTLIESWKSKVDYKMQEAITCEVLDFISQIRQKPILQTLVENALYNFIVVVGAASEVERKDFRRFVWHFNRITYDDSDGFFQKNHENIVAFTSHLSRMDNKTFESVFNGVRSDIVAAIVFTDWAGEFQRLENLELSRVK